MVDFLVRIARSTLPHEQLSRSDILCREVWEFDQNSNHHGFADWFDRHDAVDVRRLQGALKFIGVPDAARILGRALSIRKRATAKIEDYDCQWDERGIARTEVWERRHLADLEHQYRELQPEVNRQLAICYGR